ncbi:MAG: IS1595 family transposase [Rhodospirillaceae bacterium]|nr:IS1595 family transposase [Rhodospirillaceae bacterium]MYK13273.1 IS1595 family transposase [Rhodospirillaceae bacterium]
MNIRAFLAKLTPEQKAELKVALFADSHNNLSQALFENSPNKTNCPHCQHEKFIKVGKTRGVQRFKCKGCGRTFGLNTNTVVHKTHKPLHMWERYIQLMFDGYSIHKIAEELRIATATAFYWRHKILSALKKIARPNLGGIIEADETYTPLSFKGQKKGLPRKAHKRGGQVNKRGASKEQVCVLTAVDRDKNDWMKPVCLGNLSKKYLDGDFANAISPDSVLVTDGHRAYNGFATKAGLTHERVGIRPHKGAAYHVQNINSLHSQLKRFMRRFNGVATKYLDNYLVFWQWRDGDILADLASRRDAVSYRALADLRMGLV